MKKFYYGSEASSSIALHRFVYQVQHRVLFLKVEGVEPLLQAKVELFAEKMHDDFREDDLGQNVFFAASLADRAQVFDFIEYEVELCLGDYVARGQQNGVESLFAC